jgi:hypothetical protein
VTSVAATFLPIPTCEIPPPVLELAPGEGDGESPMPRVLLQGAGSGRSARRVLLLTALFLALAGLEGILLLRLPPQEPLIVYGDLPRTTLVEDCR